MLVERAKRVGRLTLQHVTGQDLGTSCPVIKCREPQGDCPVLCGRAVLETILLKALLILAQSGDDLPDPVKIVPAALAKQPDPAVKKVDTAGGGPTASRRRSEA